MRDGWHLSPVRPECAARGIMSSERYVGSYRLGALYAPWLDGWIAEIESRAGHGGSFVAQSAETRYADEAAAQIAAESAVSGLAAP